VEREAQRGSSLIETAVAVAIVAIVASTALGATIAVTHAAGGDPVRDALQTAVEREMHVALDVVKYQAGSIAPTVIATTIPMPAGSPLPVQLSIDTSPLPQGAVRVTIAAVAAQSGERADLTAALSDRAPQPGALLRAPGLAPAPTGAP
jgi:hypothetical protein